MLLTCDIGNTNISLGIFDKSNGPPLYEPKATWRIATDRAKLVDEYALQINHLMSLRMISPDDITQIAICSGVPTLTSIFHHISSETFKLEPLIVGSGTRTGIKVLYDNPRDVGADRIVDAAAALNLYGGPVIIVDFGTATVFDGVKANGDYLGGAIAPGISIAADALYHNASMLRRVELVPPPTAIGKNTIHAIQSGLIFGYSELVKGMVDRFDKELGGGCKVVATGGLAEIIQNEITIFDNVSPHLTLKGLKIIQDMNGN